MIRSKNRLKQIPYIFLSPIIIWFAIFLIFPLIFALYLSFHEWSIISPNRPFVGLGNYIGLFSDNLFWVSLKNTFLYVGMGMPAGLVIALALALLVRSITGFKGLFRTIYFVPVVTSLVACSIVWRWLYQPTFGLFNQLLSYMHIAPQQWLNSPSQALFSLVLFAVWKGVGYWMIIFLAGLEGIPDVYYEAAKIDGASKRQTFFHITLPLLKPTITFATVVCAIGAFQVFAQPYLMTSTGGRPPGGPADSTRVLVLRIYNLGFRLLRMGYASSMAFVLFAIILALSLIQLKLLKGGKY